MFKQWTSNRDSGSRTGLTSPSLSTSATSPAEGNSLSPSTTDRVFPIRSVVSMDPTPTPVHRPQGDYFPQYTRASDARNPSEDCNHSAGWAASYFSQPRPDPAPGHGMSGTHPTSNAIQTPSAPSSKESTKFRRGGGSRVPPGRLPAQVFSDIISYRSVESGETVTSTQGSFCADKPPSGAGGSSIKSGTSSVGEMGGFMTHRFQHVVTEHGHAIITGRDGETLQRCEDEPIHIPGAVQGFGLLIVLQEDPGGNGNLLVRIVSENSKRIIGRTPRELFALESFTDILSEEQTDNLLDHIDFIQDEESDVAANGPDVFTISIKVPNARSRKLWCAMHMNEANRGLIICEFELEDDKENPVVPPNEHSPELPEDTLSSNPTPEEFAASTEIKSRPLRVLRSARKRKGEAAAMEVFSIMSQVQEQLAAAPNLETFLQVLVGVVKELTGFHRVMIYQFDQAMNGRVVTELVDPRATKDLYHGLNFPASDIPKQARDLYRLNRVRMLYDRDQVTARLVCRTPEDLETPLDLSYSYLRAMSPIHLKYLANMAVRSSMSISINAFNELWGLIACHSYGPRGMRVSFPIRKMCRLIGDSASRNVERLSYASRLQARKLINTAPTQHNPSGYIIASSDDLLKLFNADFGLLSIRGETKILGTLEQSQEALAMLEYLRMRKITSVLSSQDITQDFPDLRYPPGFQVIAGMLVVPLTIHGDDFIVFFRKGQLREVKWAGNPYEKFVREGTEGYLEPRKSFRTWCETVVGKCREWTEEEIETAATLCLVYGKFIDVWRQKEAALQSSQLTRLLLANSAHEVRTPLNAIINYLEIALEGSIDPETRENLARSHSASKSLIYVINDLLDLTKTEEGGPLIKGEEFDLGGTLHEATDMFRGDAKRKNITYEVIEHHGLPKKVIGDQRRVRQAISNITANAIQNTTEGGVKVEMYVAAFPSKEHAEVEVTITDTGVGMGSTKLDELFNALEQVQSTPGGLLEEALAPSTPGTEEDHIKEKKSSLGLGLAVVARIIRNMNGQLRLKSEEGKGSRFVINFPFNLPEGSITPQADITPLPTAEERTLIAPDSLRKDSDSGKIARKASAESLNEGTSLKSFTSGDSNKSQRSDMDRLIEAIQEPHLVEKQGDRSMSPRASRPALVKRGSRDGASLGRGLSTNSVPFHDGESTSQHQGSRSAGAGEESAPVVKAVKISDDGVVSPKNVGPEPGSIIGEVVDEPPPSSRQMRVLVAEDDPINSRIISKRLEKLGHDVRLTVNGEECATAFGGHAQDFDVILMDMQMPIVDGLTSTKMIRSFEKTHPGNILSPRAALNGRIPIIAVSASLLEKELPIYVEAGFDAWILKPISFDRLSLLMAAIVDPEIRKECLHEPGQWEKGGWFHQGPEGPELADTKLDQRPQPQTVETALKISETDTVTEATVEAEAAAEQKKEAAAEQKEEKEPH
ncbi:hypothetical protein GQ43DRAFT_368279 [Delitschia confertaspora ATCC 74209]|uniref:Uncharacterized protein n=1 Tax=Delitschia confertaspora ATCC 74209 TaxID=1513339 RepID=A0A9P4MU81_9PLEO|nr:hypothetical protein GQ43DRAFT_368279 [Delitschia confertaspora ATCC 74209]